MNSVLAVGLPGVPELIVIAIIGVLVFGKRFAELGRITLPAGIEWIGVLLLSITICVVYWLQHK